MLYETPLRDVILSHCVPPKILKFDDSFYFCLLVTALGIDSKHRICLSPAAFHFLLS